MKTSESESSREPLVAHVAAHELGASAYAIRAAMEALQKAEREAVRLTELEWQREQLPE
jgi:hypothetical protein